MEERRLEQLLASVAAGKTSVDKALSQLKCMPFEDLGIARPDLHRHLRQGTPECIFCQGKTPEQVVEICASLLQGAGSILATRCDTATFAALKERFASVTYHRQARIAEVRAESAAGTGSIERNQSAGAAATEAGGSPKSAMALRARFTVAILTAGTSDIPVAEESAVVLEHFGFSVTRIFDVGVAGLHRVLSQVEGLQAADAIIVVAGMDGALPSVVGGLVACPVVAVPTSVGYGASFEGLAALLTMLNSCAHGVTVVNIDNGFGAAMSVVRMLLARAAEREKPKPSEPAIAVAK